MEEKLYNQEGKEVGKLELPEYVFNLPWNADLVHQVSVSMMANIRMPLAHAKTRGEVRGGGKKPWRQKGTGRARHGSSRSPIWVGGGVTHGPRNDKIYAKKINKKMKSKALYTVLSKKYKNGEIIFVDNINLPMGKTKEALSVIKGLGSIPGYELVAKKRSNALCITVPKEELVSGVKRAFSNIGKSQVITLDNLNALHALTYKYLVLSSAKNIKDFFNTGKEKNSKELSKS
ncbi:MAG: 50S ribosomal protein L4 [Candidatus Taylorbacteria bacterium RIFCSPLOWO2_12_FULL_43_20]|uniref:Large ribosomal subunit protein uL4 n=1 Tax=Candidatus Taylorbacteria bacterium RIFCSPLOWO2_12_FULL_43_20 TaxID=1802332 RepID=A0A1G2P4H8_9BACT|nr:MAG: 50S ribosomal protein L4 [Candidatus Taylorbacteria bacterium RIFCSPHIGHO2_01_FULL_43_120]OHA23448.1 MAG: 50S ribosomal protein L4 [Candidatus Taylorbacteria bacterium RIFCSPHIGHO2_02_FULL_43_55]OHA29653.1 MAG: 50S ribosomal protein L4 [Candidatus Taylorbacteria bacterium RIFCSPHIGHO2_12_FULL_42_34]OHA31581.1 MAG: 50S ribosomal protein L4 [Candidatus Taylorbacteria bacterium RIFCSPLOWO2_01_FULL_43_83]OHA38962.1 MAG: 50S ribosomal protein L4 [Candidatus Taylorbacteria bacterium RIFCSPLOW